MSEAIGAIIGLVIAIIVVIVGAIILSALIPINPFVAIMGIVLLLVVAGALVIGFVKQQTD
jgi:hypothetical protein